MRAIIASLALAFAASVYAGEEPEYSADPKQDGRVTEFETKQAADINNTVARPVKKELQERPVKMIVGGQSTDGVAKEVIVSPEQ